MAPPLKAGLCAAAAAAALVVATGALELVLVGFDVDDELEDELEPVEPGGFASSGQF
jgi:hypothetical protein